MEYYLIVYSRQANTLITFYLQCINIPIYLDNIAFILSAHNFIEIGFFLMTGTLRQRDGFELATCTELDPADLMNRAMFLERDPCTRPLKTSNLHVSIFRIATWPTFTSDKKRSVGGPMIKSH